MDPKDIKPGQRWKIEAEVEVVRGLSDLGNIYVTGLREEDGTNWIDPKHFISLIEPPLSVGDRVMWDGSEYEVAAPPSEVDNGVIEVALWRVGAGYFGVVASQCERIP